MSVEDNKALARRVIEEGWDQGKMDVEGELLSPDYVGHGSRVGGSPEIGHDYHSQHILKARTSFPDLRITVEEQIAEGDLVMTRWTAQGTHQGKLRGHDPTGKQMTLAGIVIYRIVNGQIVEGREIRDTLSMMQQLGLVP